MANPIPGGGMPGPVGRQGGVTTSSSNPWLKLAQDAFSKSTTYFESNYRKNWEDGLRMFNSKHPSDSKYNSPAYQYRSRIFRPKTRSVIRRHEATAALAFFSNPDAVSVDPVAPSDPMQIASSLVMRELLQYRLTKTIPWFLTLMGGFQDAMTVGLVASMQYWDYRKRTESRRVPAQMGDTTVLTEIEEEVAYKDEPCIKLIPIEHIRFDPAAEWTNIVATSPYLIVQMPMYIRDILERIDQGEWKDLEIDKLLQARITEHSVLQAARDMGQQDPRSQTSQVNEFDVAMVHLNFVKLGAQTYTYYTLKDQELLSEPGLLAEVFLHNEIPVTIGFCVLESHKPVPTSLVNLGSQLQQEANEIVNQRLDNVKLVLNKRWFIRRGSNLDVEALLRNVPGGVSMVNDVEKDAREVNWNDVTSSAYQEQNLVNVDYDELLGSFMQSSVMTNRKLNETVGGMRMMAQGANMITEYTIRTLVETWIEPMLRQLVKLEQHYETDEVILAVAQERAQLFQRFGMHPDLDRLLAQELTLSVNVGMGATDPDTRFQRLMQSFGAYNQFAMGGSPDLNLPEIRKEIFGLAGFKDAERFFNPQIDPRLLMMQQQLQAAQQQASEMIQKAKDQLASRERQLDNREHQMDMELLEAQQEFGREAQKAQQDFMLAVSEHLADSAMKAEVHIQGMAQMRDKAAIENATQVGKANLDAAIKTFNAKLDAALKRMKAEVDADAKRTIAAATASKKKIAKRKGPGEWEVTES